MGFGPRGVNVEIPLFLSWDSNTMPLRSGWWTFPGGEFDWGGRLLKSSGGAQRFPQAGWKSA